jgi:outer membrane protein TolC
VLAACALAAALFAAPAFGRCVDENDPEIATPGQAAPLPVEPPRTVLAQMVRDTLARSQAVGAGKLLAEAALDEVAQQRASTGMQASVGGNIGPAVSRSFNVTNTSAMQGTASLSVSQLLYDGGRTDRLVGWRSQLAEAARYGSLSQQEQLAANTVALALERSRYRQHVLVYGQYVRKMSCLVEALETIVRADRGRASELVLARKTLQQAELSQAEAVSQVRQVEVRLRRFVGDGLPSPAGLATVLMKTPPLEELLDDVERSNDLATLAAQAAAADKLAQAADLAMRPQVSWTVGSTAAARSGGQPAASSLGVGVAINIPLLNPGAAPASASARKRAEAARLQREEELQSRRSRVADLYEQTQSSFDRARRVGAVLRDSEQVRNFTLQQWQQLGKRSLFDVMGAETEHYNLRVSYVNALHDGGQLNALLLSLGRGVGEWLR